MNKNHNVLIKIAFVEFKKSVPAKIFHFNIHIFQLATAQAV